MKKIYPILLIGLLSMLFAEIFSGASTTWFINPLGVLLTLPLYMFHLLFLLWIAVEYNKISLRQLYFFGIIFALYESWITKVLWAGYINADGPAIGTFLGIAPAEFLVLVLFWHPLMSFIVPILVFQLFTGKVFSLHADILEKTKKRTYFIALFILLFSTFIANGNSFDIMTANISVLGTLLLVFVLKWKSAGADILSLHFRKKYFVLMGIYLFILYCVTFMLFLPERIPGTILPYVSVLIFYALAIVMISRSEKQDVCLVELPDNSYSSKDIFRYAVLLVLAVNIACLVPYESTILVGVTYLSMGVAGLILFMNSFYREIKSNKH